MELSHNLTTIIILVKENINYLLKIILKRKKYTPKINILFWKKNMMIKN